MRWIERVGTTQKSATLVLKAMNPHVHDLLGRSGAETDVEVGETGWISPTGRRHAATYKPHTMLPDHDTLLAEIPKAPVEMEEAVEHGWIRYALSGREMRVQVPHQSIAHAETLLRDTWAGQRIVMDLEGTERRLRFDSQYDSDDENGARAATRWLRETVRRVNGPLSDNVQKSVTLVLKAQRPRYIRFQPRGLPVLGHTSGGSTSPLPTGYVFAYREGSTEPLNAEGLPLDDDLRHLDAITLEGTDEYNPGDVEGVAIRPVSEIQRESVHDWLTRVAPEHPDSAESIARLLPKATPRRRRTMQKSEHWITPHGNVMEVGSHPDLVQGDRDEAQRMPARGWVRTTDETFFWGHVRRDSAGAV